MKKKFNFIVQILKQIKGVKVIESQYQTNSILILEFDSLEIFYFMTREIFNPNLFQIILIPNSEYPNKISCKIEFPNKTKSISIFFDSIQKFFENDLKKMDYQKYGIPDLSLVTIKQMANELKNRKNICYALVWMEDAEKENISVEGSGDPNQVVGLMTRGLHMTIDWSNKNMLFKSDN